MIFWDKLKTFNTLYEKLTEPVREQYKLTQMEFDIIMFLYNNPQYNTAGDMVHIRHLTKSHVSTSVASLEGKGLIRKISSAGSRKNIRLELTDNSAEIVTAGANVQGAFGNILIKGFSEEDKNKFEELFLRICANADAQLNRRK